MLSSTSPEISRDRKTHENLKSTQGLREYHDKVKQNEIKLNQKLEPGGVNRKMSSRKINSKTYPTVIEDNLPTSIGSN